MGDIFGGGSKPKTVKPPPVPDPPAIPVVSDEQEELEIQKLRQRSGVSRTFITGNLTPRSTGKKRTLG